MKSQICQGKFIHTAMHKQEAVFFDVDDTLIRGQSQKLFINFLWKRRLVSTWFYIQLMFWFLLYKLRIINDPSKIATQAFSFLKNTSREKLIELVDLFFDQELIGQFYQEALSIIKEHQKEGRRIYLVSNAFDTLVERIVRYINANGYISTNLKEENGILNGEIDGTINYGKAKALRVKEFCIKNSISLENSWGYADHPSDVDFLRLVSNPVVVNTNKGFQNQINYFNFQQFKE